MTTPPTPSLKSLRLNHFDERIWLTDAEWITYLRRPPVRYPSVRKDVIDRDGPLCTHCGSSDETTQPLQMAHRIGFNQGVAKFGLTPDFLDGADNIVLAHRGACNNHMELTDVDAAYHLERLGHDLSLSAPIRHGLMTLHRDQQGRIIDTTYTCAEELTVT